MSQSEPVSHVLGKNAGGDTPQRAVFLSVVVPCLNEEAVLSELHRRLSETCRKASGDSYEIVLVDDGSSDNTRSVMRELVASDPRVSAVLLSRNHGHQAALTAGLFQTRGERILIIDADLQDPPELAVEMMQIMDRGYDVVYGQRTARQGETYFKRAGAAFFYRLLNRMIDIDIPRDAGDFRLISRRALDVLLSMPEQHRFIRGMIGWIGFPQTALKYVRDERFAGSSKYPIRKMIRFALDGITSFSTVPLRLASYLGLCVSALSVVMMIYALVRWWGGNTLPGWTSVVMVILLLGGLQMLILGIVGEYVGRLYLESKRRPIFVVEDVLRHDENKRPT